MAVFYRNRRKHAARFRCLALLRKVNRCICTPSRPRVKNSPAYHSTPKVAHPTKQDRTALPKQPILYPQNRYDTNFSPFTGLVPEQEDQVEEKARGGDGDRKAETGGARHPDGREQ